MINIPTRVRGAVSALRAPISMQDLMIEPITVLASVHASMKVFVALDRTVLSFGQFQTGPVFATTSQLGQALSLHYSSGAIFKAGWVLGSLEILGNPVGLLRSVGSGLADTVLLPYEGLTRGPTAFVAGLAGGLSSLVWQITAGTLTSVTKFATSVSRNLDRLSLDSDHIARQEKARRRVPQYATEGLTQGLSHFGISLLGAIAGIADQPIKGFQQAGRSGELVYVGNQAKDVISGFGKGLVGAVVKPIGGAAELVSQTGQGILHGTGLAEVTRPMAMQHIELQAKCPNGKLKYAWKMLSAVPDPVILMHARMTGITYHGLHHAGALILTTEVLFVVSLSEDTHQHVFPLHQVQCHPIRNSDEGLKFVVKGATPVSTPEVPETSDLIADFVDVTSSFIDSLDDLPGSSAEENSEASIKFDPTSFNFFMNRYQRQTFLSLFEIAKKQMSEDVFSL